MKASVIAAISTAAILFGVASAAAGDGPLVGRSGGIWGAGTPDIRLLSPSGYESRENSPQFRCTPSRAPAGASSDGPEIVRVCAPGNR
ncbi:MAG: hypothetical protein RLT05_35105 [Bauldia litoralis]